MAQVPESVTELHHEIELGVVIETRCNNVSEADAMAAVGGYLLAFDMTARNLQTLAKKSGNPWSVAKVSKVPSLPTLPSDPFARGTMASALSAPSSPAMRSQTLTTFSKLHVLVLRVLGLLVPGIARALTARDCSGCPARLAVSCAKMAIPRT